MVQLFLYQTKASEILFFHRFIRRLKNICSQKAFIRSCKTGNANSENAIRIEKIFTSISKRIIKINNEYLKTLEL